MEQLTKKYKETPNGIVRQSDFIIDTKPKKDVIKTSVDKLSFKKSLINEVYTTTDRNTQKIIMNSFSMVVSIITSKSNDISNKLIKSNNVTVNGVIVNNINHSLRKGDVVRVGIGNVLHDSNMIAIIK